MSAFGDLMGCSRCEHMVIEGERVPNVTHKYRCYCDLMPMDIPHRVGYIVQTVGAKLFPEPDEDLLSYIFHNTANRKGLICPKETE